VAKLVVPPLTAACTVNGSSSPTSGLVGWQVFFDANPDPLAGSTCEWKGAVTTPPQSDCFQSLTPSSTTTLIETVIVKNGSNSLSMTCPSYAVGDFSLSVAPTSLTISPGGTASYQLTATSINGMSGSVFFAGPNTLPAGITSSWTSPKFNQCDLPPGGTCSVTCAITVSTGSANSDTELAFSVGSSRYLVSRRATASLHVQNP
jgi:hypothetical protein